MKKLNKTFRKSENTVEAYVYCFCECGTSCYCICPAGTYANMQRTESNRFNGVDHLSTLLGNASRGGL